MIARPAGPQASAGKQPEEARARGQAATACPIASRARAGFRSSCAMMDSSGRPLGAGPRIANFCGPKIGAGGGRQFKTASMHSRPRLLSPKLEPIRAERTDHRTSWPARKWARISAATYHRDSCQPGSTCAICRRGSGSGASCPRDIGRTLESVGILGERPFGQSQWKPINDRFNSRALFARSTLARLNLRAPCALQV